jgi:hypothetical protein
VKLLQCVDSVLGEDVRFLAFLPNAPSCLVVAGHKAIVVWDLLTLQPRHRYFTRLTDR